jgi:hypothetical protein
MVHFWEKLKEASKWRVGYATNHDVVKHGTTTLVVDGEDDDLGQNALPPRLWGHKATKADLAREASALAFSLPLEKIMTESQVGPGQKGREEASAAIYYNLTKEVIEVQKMNVTAKRADA